MRTRSGRCEQWRLTDDGKGRSDRRDRKPEPEALLMARRALLHKGFKKGNRRFAHGGWVDKRNLCWGKMRDEDEDGICVDRGGVAGKRRLR